MKKLLLITTALVAAASPAHADPISAVATWVAGTFSIGAATALAVTQFAFGLGMSAISQALMKPDKPEVSVSFDVQMGDDLPLSFVVGDYATAGQRKFINSWGKNTRFITEVIEVSALPQGLAAMWVNDEPANLLTTHRAYIPAGSTPGGTSQIAEHPVGSGPAGSLDMGTPLQNYAVALGANDARLWVKWVNGTQVASDPFLTWAFGSDDTYPWTSAMIGRGKTYAIITAQYDKESLSSYPAFLFQPAPLPLYDLRFDSTNGGSGSQRWNDRSTWQPTRNNAVVGYNIARGMYYDSEWVFGGKNLPAWRLPQAEWIAAANACDAPATRANGTTEPRYRCGMEVRADMEPASVLEEIGKAANMKFVEVGGRLKPIVDLPGAAVLSITDGDILTTQGQSLAPFLPLAETFNAISATYPERGEKWASKDAPMYVDAAATADDGGRYLPTSMAYGAVPFAGQVQRLMRSQMRDFRRMRKHQFHLPPDAYGLEPGVDLISWTSERNGYGNKLFMVERVAKTPGMNVLVSLREVDPSDYDWSSAFEQPIVITPPVNPVPFVQPINGLTATGVVIYDAASKARRSVIRVACEGDEEGVTHIHIERRLVGQVTAQIEPPYPFIDPYQWDLRDVIPGQTYEVRARLISELTPRSEWSGWITAQAPAVGLGWDDLDAEINTTITGWQTWADGTGAYLRDIMDELGVVQDEVIEGDFGAFTERSELRASIQGVQVSLGEQSATTASAIDALIVRVGEAEGGTTALSEAITLVEAKTDRSSAEGLLRVTAEATPAGSQSCIGIRAEASEGDASHSAAIFVEAKSDGTSQVGVVANRFFIASSDAPGAAWMAPFIVDAGVVYINNARIRNLSVENIEDGAVTNFGVAGSGAQVVSTINHLVCSTSVPVGAYSARLLISYDLMLDGLSSTWGPAQVRIFINGVVAYQTPIARYSGEYIGMTFGKLATAANGNGEIVAELRIASASGQSIQFSNFTVSTFRR